MSFFLERVYEEGIYNVKKGNVFFLVSLNVRCHDVTKHVLKVAVFTLKWFVGYTHMMSYFAFIIDKVTMIKPKKLTWLFSAYHGGKYRISIEYSHVIRMIILVS